MGNYEQLKAAVSDVIKTNGTQAITGQVLQNTLLTIINSLGSNYQFVGIAETNTNPGTPDQNVFYLAGEGTYTNFSNLTIETGQLGVLKWNGSWSKQVLEIGASGGNVILNWNTDTATTRKEVLSKYRKEGLQISYKDPEKGWINEQYVGINTSDTEWVKDQNWEKIPNETLIDSIQEKMYENTKTLSSLQDCFSTKSNIYNGELSQSGYYNQYDNGKPADSNGFIRDPSPFNLIGGEKLYYYIENYSSSIRLLEYDENDDFIKQTSLNRISGFITLDNNTKKGRLYADVDFDNRFSLGYEEFSQYEVYTLELKGENIKDGSIEKEKLNPTILEPLNKIPLLENEILQLQSYFVYVNNLVLNGNMSDGTNNWLKFSQTANLTIEDSALKITETKTDVSNVYIRQNISEENVIVGKKYFVAFESNVSRQAKAIRMMLYSSGNISSPFSSLVSENKEIGWTNNYGIISVPENTLEGTLYFTLRADYTSGSEFALSVKNVMIFPLDEFEEIGLIDAIDIFEFIQNNFNGYIGQSQNVADLKYILNEVSKIDTRLYGKTTVVFGDSVMDYCNIPETLAKISGMNVINCAVGGTRMGQHIYENYGAWSFYKLADAIVSGDYSEQEAATSIGKNILQRIANLISINWEEVDNLIIGFGTNDWISSNNINIPGEDFTSIYYSLVYGLSKIMTKYPKIKIYVITPSFRIFEGESSDTYIYNQNNLTLPQVVECIEKGAKFCHVLCCNNYWELQINKDNYKYYLDGTDTESGDSGYVHPNITVGAQAFANRIFNYMKSN